MIDDFPDRETHVAVQGVCAWPNLTQLKDGTIVAVLFNQPCHGKWEGDLDCYASTDGGFVWNYRGRACEHEPGTARMNCAAGLDNDDNLLVLCSGWDGRAEPYGESKPFGESKCLRAVACRSTDQGKTWTRIGELPQSPGTTELIPFGDIFKAEDGSLRAAAYTKLSDDHSFSATFMLISRDSGVTWQVHGEITQFGNETALLPLGGGKWLAAARTPGSTRDAVAIPITPDAPETAMKRMIVMHRSSDDGKSWQYVGPLTATGQIPGHLMMLDDGGILLSYGNRCPNNLGIDVRVSRDGGLSWGIPIRLADMGPGDGGYPSTIRRPDGHMVTAFYNKVSGAYHREMSVTRWRLSAFDNPPDNRTYAW